MAGKRHSLLENAEPTSNPFAMFQTIPVSNEEAEPRSDDPFSIGAPRQAKRASLQKKRKPAGGKRMSAPPSTIAQQQVDLLPADLFTSSPFDPVAGGSSAPGSQAGSQASSARSSQIFDPFDPALSSSAPSSNPRDSINSVTSGELFDPNMWGFGSADPFAPAGAPGGGLALKPSSSNPVPSQRAQHQSALAAVVESPHPTREDTESDSEDSDEKDDLGDLPDSDVLERAISSTSAGRRASAPAQSITEETSNCLPELHRGTALLKYPRRHGFPHFKHVQLSRDNLRMQWFSKRKTLDETCIYISDIREVVEGQKTEVFKKYRQQVLDKASFSIVYGHDYKTFDVVAKSTDECHMWVLGIQKLMELHREGRALNELPTLDVGIKFRDRNRPQSRRGSGRFLRANNSKALNVDPATLKEVEKDLDNLQRSYHRVSGLSQRTNITRSPEFHNIQQVLSELEERLEELTHEVANTRDTDMSQRDVWRANVDLTAIQEKIEVLLKYYDANGRAKS